MAAPEPDLHLQKFDRLAAYLRAGRAPWRARDGAIAFLVEKEGAAPDIAVSPAAFGNAMEERFADEIRDAAVEQLWRDRPAESARRLQWRPLLRGAILIAFAFAAAAAAAPAPALTAVIMLASAIPLTFLACRIGLLAAGVGAPRAAAPAIADKDLPTVTILAPMFREAASLPAFVRSIAALDYPAEKLDIKLLLEEEDLETRREAKRFALPAHFQVTVIPACLPQTKPKACNYGLATARGDLLVIYDAEDAPETDQLRKAAARFAVAADDVACLQARLNFYNSDDNWLTRQFALEYALWFDHMLPGLEAIGAPVPLGGTSNIFRTDALRAVGGWDPFNVTEDAELGLRLARSGWRVGVLDSTTWEEAPVTESAWLRQRSRWMKGYLQTWLTHRRSGRRVRHGWLTADLFIGGAVAAALAAPLLWTSALLGATAGWPAAQIAAGALGIAQIAFIALAAFAPIRRGMGRHAPWALMAPLYWMLMSVAAWRAVVQLVRAPHYWEKTEHGVSAESRSSAAGAVGLPRPPPRRKPGGH